MLMASHNDQFMVLNLLRIKLLIQIKINEIVKRQSKQTVFVVILSQMFIFYKGMDNNFAKFNLVMLEVLPIDQLIMLESKWH